MVEGGYSTGIVKTASMANKLTGSSLHFYYVLRISFGMRISNSERTPICEPSRLTSLRALLRVVVPFGFLVPCQVILSANEDIAQEIVRVLGIEK